MNLGNALLTSVFVAAFIGVLVMGVIGIRSTARSSDNPARTRPKPLRKKRRAGTAPPGRGQQRKRGRRGRNRDQRADLLPPDATLSFADERGGGHRRSIHRPRRRPDRARSGEEEGS